MLVYGDTNSTLAGALAGAQAGIPVAHVEAGMRSYDRTMPEELNRVLTDHASDLLLCSAEAPAATLRAEQVVGAIEVVGDVMVDVARLLGPARGGPDRRARRSRGRAGRVPARHRPSRGQRGRSRPPGAPGGAAAGAAGPVVLPLHPRTRARLEAAGRLDGLGLVVTPPLGYLEFTALLHNARAVLTDSGGVQKEAYLAGVPCLTLRSTTEWTETVTAGWNVLVDLDAGAALAALERTPPGERPPLYGDGRAGERVAAALARRMAA